MNCSECRHVRRMTWWGRALPVGKVRCAHLVTKMPCPLVSTEDSERRPAARHLIGVQGPFGRHQDGNDRFAWPWSFDPDLLEACEGFEPAYGRRRS